MPFVVGESYSRDHIHAELGVDMISYLPQREGRIVCGCFSVNSNPEAPYEILVGGSDENGAIQRKARLLAKQGGTIPVFLKHSAYNWKFDGFYRVKSLSEDAAYLSQKQEKARRTGVVMALFLEAVDMPNWSTYLLTWNPLNWKWDDLEEESQRTAEGQPVDDRWSCGNTKRIRSGDRLFLLRQGVEPRGIVASGWATSASYEGPHWDATRREQGDTALHIEVRFERILNPDFDDPLPLDKLRSGPLASVNWATPASGIEIKEGVEDLERLWSEHLHLFAAGIEDIGDMSALEGEARMALRRHRTRERWLRDAKLEEAKKKDGRLPCEACGFDFFDVYGEIGRDFAHVHHLKPLGDRTRPSLTNLDDLAVVCANCHAMLHRGPVALPLNDLLEK